MNTVSQARAILRAVTDDPHDMLPRLVYADWLEENGGEAGAVRASMIRGTWDGVPPWDGSWYYYVFPELNPLRKWLSDHDEGVLGMYVDYEKFLQAYDGKWVNVRRGFVVTVICPLRAWDVCGAGISGLNPVRSVIATGKKPHNLGGAWRWYPGSSFDGEPQLPSTLCEFAGWKHEFIVGGVMSYPFRSSDLACAALNEALVAWARRE